MSPDGTYHVTDREAHAWPEVFLADFGWVAFEPTPGRAVPGGEDYTGVRSPTGPAGTDPGASAATTVAPTTVAAPSEATATTLPEEEPAAPAEAGEDDGSSLLTDPRALLALAALAYGVGGPVAGRLRRSRRRARAATPTDRVLVAWDEAGEDLALAGLGRQPSETAAE